MTSKMATTSPEKDLDPTVQIVFTSLVKKLSRRFRIWQQRILTLNSQGDISISRVEQHNTSGIVLVSSSTSQQNRSKQKVCINTTESGTMVSQGKSSDVRWPAKLDLRQTLVLKSTSYNYVFFPSVRAAETLRTHLHILELRQESEQSGSDMECQQSVADTAVERSKVTLCRKVSESCQSLPDIDTDLFEKRNTWRDDIISREGTTDTQLTLLTRLDRQKSFSLVSLVDFTDTIKDSLSHECLHTDDVSSNTDEKSVEKRKKLKTVREELEKEVDPFEMCFDFTSGPGYLACNRNSIITDSSIISMNNPTSRRDSLIFRPSTQFRPKSILKPTSLYVGEKKETESRVRFNTCPSVRIISRVESNNNGENVPKDYDLVSHYIYKYVVNSHKLKSDRFNARKKQA